MELAEAAAVETTTQPQDRPVVPAAEAQQTRAQVARAHRVKVTTAV